MKSDALLSNQGMQPVVTYGAQQPPEPVYQAQAVPQVQYAPQQQFATQQVNVTIATGGVAIVNPGAFVRVAPAFI
jgi:hypothetical protein